MTKKEHALKISEMWLRIAESETPLGFCFRLADEYMWAHATGAPDELSDLSNWKVGPVRKPISRINAAYFASLWKQVSEGASFECRGANDFRWEKVDSAPVSYDYPELWRVVKDSPKPSVTYVWKRTDTGEFTDDPIEVSYWEKRNCPIQRFVSEEQA
jgi:hypothetical protein